jgi:hypothetical protein
MYFGIKKLHTHKVYFVICPKIAYVASSHKLHVQFLDISQNKMQAGNFLHCVKLGKKYIYIFLKKTKVSNGF